MHTWLSSTRKDTALPPGSAQKPISQTASSLSSLGSLMVFTKASNFTMTLTQNSSSARLSFLFPSLVYSLQGLAIHSRLLLHSKDSLVQEMSVKENGSVRAPEDSAVATLHILEEIRERQKRY